MAEARAEAADAQRIKTLRGGAHASKAYLGVFTGVGGGGDGGSRTSEERWGERIRLVEWWHYSSDFYRRAARRDEQRGRGLDSWRDLAR